MRATSLLAGATAVLALGTVRAEDSSHSSHDTHDHDSHGHEEHLFEQSFLYDMTNGTQNLITMPGGEETTFEGDSLAFMVVAATSSDEEGLEGAVEAAESAWESYLDGDEDPTVLASGDSAAPSDSVVYQISLEDPLVLVPVDVVEGGPYAFLFEHGSEEVSVVVTSESGVVLVAAAEEGTEEEEDEDSSATAKMWLHALIASVVVSLCSLIGLVIIASDKIAHSINLSQAAGFASGALLTASFLHIIPEGMEGLQSKYPSLHDLGLRAGVAVLAGISVGVIIHAIMEAGHSHHTHNGSTAASDGKLVSSGNAPISNNGDGAATLPSSPNNLSSGSDVDTKTLHDMMNARKGRALTDIKDLQPVCWNLILGDFVHNFSDGVLIGAAFLGCSFTMGWTVTASIVLHEVPHELADFMALINGGMSKAQAFFYNFLSALSAILGVVIILALRETLTNVQVSFILLIGGGTFVFMALAELLPDALASTGKVENKRNALISQMYKLLAFVAGAIIIGIPLLFDQHCEADGHEH